MVNVHSVQVVVAVVCNDDLVCMVCKCTALCHVVLSHLAHCWASSLVSGSTDIPSSSVFSKWPNPKSLRSGFETGISIRMELRAAVSSRSLKGTGTTSRV